jgi:Ca2+-binding EF-hand superfamily protein
MSRQTAHHPRKWQKFNISSPKMPKNLANLSVLDSPLGDTPTEALEQDNATLKKQNKSLRYIVRLMERKILELTGHPAAALSVGLAKQTGQYKMNRTVFELLKDSEKGVKRMKRMESEGRLGGGEGEGGGAGGGGGGGGGDKHGSRHGGGRDGSDSEDAGVRGDRESNRERVRRRPRKDTKGDREGGGGEDGHGRGSGRGPGRGYDDCDDSDAGAQPDAAAAGAAAEERDNLPTNEAGRALWAGRRQEGRHRVGVSGGRVGGGAVSDGDEGDYDGDDDFPGASYGGPKKHRRRRTRLASPEDDEEGGGVSAQQSTPPSRTTLNFAHTHDGTVAVRRNRRRAGGRHRDHLQFGRQRERGGEEDGADEDEDEEGVGEEGGVYVTEDNEEMLEERTREEERQQRQRRQHEDGGEDSGAVANSLRDVDLRTLVKEEITMALRSHMSEILALATLAKGEATQVESESGVENTGATPGRKGGQLRPLPAANHNESRQPNWKSKTNQKEKKTGRHNQLDPLEQQKGAKKNAKAATSNVATPTQKRRKKKKKATSTSPLRFGGPLPRGDGGPLGSPLALASVANNSERELAAIRIQYEVRERRERRRNQTQGISSVTDEDAVEEGGNEGGQGEEVGQEEEEEEEEEVGNDDTGAEAEDANVGAEKGVAQDAHATVIQSCYRGKQARLKKTANKRHTSATALQSRYRGKQARKLVDTQHRSATALQSRYRGKQARKSVDNQHTSATVLQARHRGKLSRRASKSAAEAASAKVVAEAEEAAAVAEASALAKVAAEAEEAAAVAAAEKAAAEAEAAAAAETAEVEEAAAAAEAVQGNSGFGSEMHQTLTILFTTLDIDKDGFVDKGEVLGTLRDPDESTIALLRRVPALAGLLKPQHFTKTFEAMDTNQDGAVDLGELLSFCEEGRHLYKAGDDDDDKGSGGDGDDGENAGNEVENGAETEVDEEQKQNEEARRTSAALSIQTQARGRSARKVAGARKTARHEEMDAASVLEVTKDAIGGGSTATVRPTSAELAEEFREQEQRVVAAVAIQKQVRGQSARNAMARRREEGDPEENFSAEYARLQEQAEAVEAAGEPGEPGEPRGGGEGEGGGVTGGGVETGGMLKEGGAEAVAGAVAVAAEGGEMSSFKALAEEGHAMVSEENKEANSGDEAGATVDVAGADEDASHAAETVDGVEAVEVSAEETGNGESDDGAGGATGGAAGEAAVVRPDMT